MAAKRSISHLWFQITQPNCQLSLSASYVTWRQAAAARAMASVVPDKESHLLPSIFISHGSPMLALETGDTQSFLARLGNELGKPDGILMVSAHWETSLPQASAAAEPATIHDFGGFPAALHQMQYHAPGSPGLAARAVNILRGAGLDASVAQRGLDHGAWVPLSLMYPAADVPVIQISIQPEKSPSYHARLGAALRPLRDQGTLLIASGSLTHNLGFVRGRAVDAPVDPRAAAFSAWIKQAVEAGRVGDLFDYRRLAPHAEMCHPTDEHLQPLFVALGAGDPGSGRQIHAGFTYSVLSMDAYAFR